MTKLPQIFLPILLIILMINLMILININSIHPLKMLINLIIMIIIITFIMNKWNKIYFFSYLLFLVMISGLLIMMFYFSSMIPNKKMEINSKMMILTLNLAILMIMTIFITVNMSLMDLEYLQLNIMNNLYSIESLSMYKFLDHSKTFMIMMMLFLMIMMINISKIFYKKKSLSIKIKYEKIHFKS